MVRLQGLMSQGSLGGFGEGCELFTGWWSEEFDQGACFPALKGDRRMGSQGALEDEGEVAGGVGAAGFGGGEFAQAADHAIGGAHLLSDDV